MEGTAELGHHNLGAASSSQAGLDVDHADIVISATTANVRPESLAALAAGVKVDIWLMEKILAQSEKGLAKLQQLIEPHGKAFVNTPRRAMTWYADIAEALRPTQLQEIHVSGGRLGLLCNAIHFLDLAAFLFDDEPEFISLETGPGDWHDAKRSGFIETFGTVTGEFSGGRHVKIQSNDDPRMNSIRIITSGGDWYINELEGLCEGPDGQIVRGTLTYQSDLTPTIVEQLLSSGTCELPSLGSSVSIHGQFLKAVGVALQKSGRKIGEDIPIT